MIALFCGALSAMMIADQVELVIFIILDEKRTVLYGFAWKACAGDGAWSARVRYGSGTLCCPTGGSCARDRYESARGSRPECSGPGRLTNRICAWRTSA